MVNPRFVKRKGNTKGNKKYKSKFVEGITNPGFAPTSCYVHAIVTNESHVVITCY